MFINSYDSGYPLVISYIEIVDLATENAEDLSQKAPPERRRAQRPPGDPRGFDGGLGDISWFLYVFFMDIRTSDFQVLGGF